MTQTFALPPLLKMPGRIDQIFNKKKVKDKTEGK